jgi:polysaccharide deacetylase 2 family uncharacterized protein YibQ
MKKTRRKSKKKNSTLNLFIWFTVIAIATIVILEYIDFKKGQKSFIFTKVIPLTNRAGNIRKFNQKLVSILKKNNIPHDYFLDEDNKYHFKLDINQSRYDSLIQHLKKVTQSLKGTLELAEIQGLKDKSIMLYNVFLDKKVTHFLLISKHKPAKAKKKSAPQKEPEITEDPEEKIPPIYSGNGPRIAFIIDDVGVYDIGPLELKQLNIPITASILPHSRRVQDVVHWAKEYQLEAMIHLPMQPTNQKGKRLDRKKVITMQSTDAEIRALIRYARRAVPTARGTNNHQGSLITANPGIMKRVLKIIKEEKLFFIDSRTIGSTVAYDLAKKMNIRTAHKDVFIDHIQTYSHSIAQIQKLVEVARLKGKAIAIGHPFPTTIRAIRDSLKYIRSKGIKIVFAKQLLE